jgi:hypothetical protein
MENFQGERLVASLGALAAMDKGLRWAIDYGHQRNAFGQPIGKFQVWRHRFAEHLTAVESGPVAHVSALDLVNHGKRAVREITMAKLYTTELSQKVAYDCMQIFGGFAYTTEYPVGRMWRDLRLKHDRRRRFRDHEGDYCEAGEALICIPSGARDHYSRNDFQEHNSSSVKDFMAIGIPRYARDFRNKNQ